MSAFKYRPDIDGLRAVAVLLVVLYHADLPGVKGGFIGVDVFFIISGYLITSLIVQDLENGHFSFGAFWQRRIRRILPALLAVLTATTIAGWFLFIPHDFVLLGKQLASQTVFSSNILFYTMKGYFSPDNTTKPLLHTWSLAVEEQYYLFFPALFVLLFRKLRSGLISILIGLAVASFAASVWAVWKYPSAAFYLLPFRAWELLLGSLLACYKNPRDVGAGRTIYYEALAFAGLALIVVAGCFSYSLYVPFPGLAALVPCAGAAALIYANGQRQTWTGRVLSLPPVVFIGLVSYSYYLWHWPVLSFAKYVYQQTITQNDKLACIAAAFVLACLSWKFIETPVRKAGGIYKGKKVVYGAALAAIAVVVAASGAIIQMGGIPSRLSPEANSYAQEAFDRNLLREKCERNYLHIANDDMCETNPGKHRKPSFVLWGDSHADAITPAFVDLSKRYGKNGYLITWHGCPPLFDLPKNGGACVDFNREALAFIKRNGIRNVFLVGNWTGWLADEQIHFTQTGWFDAYKGKFNDIRVASLQRTIDALRAMGVNVFVLINNARVDFNPPRALALQAQHPFWGIQTDYPAAEYLKLREQTIGVIQRANKDPGVVFVDSYGILCKKDVCITSKDGHMLYFDDNHLSVYGALDIEEIFEPFFNLLP